jgi:hypothetical protein
VPGATAAAGTAVAAALADVVGPTDAAEPNAVTSGCVAGSSAPADSGAVAQASSSDPSAQARASRSQRSRLFSIIAKLASSVRETGAV